MEASLESVNSISKPQLLPVADSVSVNLGAYLNRILKARNWTNIILRNELRESLIQANSVAIDEKAIFSYLNELNNDQLRLIRYRVFKLAQDHFMCKLIDRLQVVKPKLSQFEVCMQQGSTNHFMIKCNAIKDVIELIEYIIDTRQNLPDRFMPSSCNCSCSSCSICCMNDGDECGGQERNYDEENVSSSAEASTYLRFPLGKKCLLNQMSSIKLLRTKIHRHQAELQSLQQSTSSVQKLERNFQLCYERFQVIKKEKELCLFWIKVLLVVISFLILIISVLIRLR